VNAIMILRVPYYAGKLSSGLTTGGLSSSAQFHRVRSETRFSLRLQVEPAQKGPIGNASLCLRTT
jgi:hypothetical protein